MNPIIQMSTLKDCDKTERDEATFRQICVGVEDSVPGIHIDVSEMRRLANDSFMVPVTFDTKFGDPLPTVEWFKKQGFKLQTHRNGGNASSYVFTLSVPMSVIRGESFTKRMMWWILILGLMVMCVWTTSRVYEVLNDEFI